MSGRLGTLDCWESTTRACGHENWHHRSGTLDVGALERVSITTTFSSSTCADSPPRVRPCTGATAAGAVNQAMAMIVPTTRRMPATMAMNAMLLMGGNTQIEQIRQDWANEDQVTRLWISFVSFDRLCPIWPFKPPPSACPAPAPRAGSASRHRSRTSPDRRSWPISARVSAALKMAPIAPSTRRIRHLARFRRVDDDRFRLNRHTRLRAQRAGRGRSGPRSWLGLDGRDRLPRRPGACCGRSRRCPPSPSHVAAGEDHIRASSTSVDIERVDERTTNGLSHHRRQASSSSCGGHELVG